MEKTFTDAKTYHHQSHDPHNIVVVWKLKKCGILKGSLAQAL